MILQCHPQMPYGAVRGVSAWAARAETGRLAIRYAIDGNLDQLRIPAPRAPARAERLWQHTCCEIFVARAPGAAYHEFNFSPSGEWAAYAFERYREGAALVGADPKISLHRSAGRLELEAKIELPPGKLRLGLCAVIEAADGTLSYWALRHPPGKPDFHHREAFVLELD